jgi:hypothetical protein
VRPPVRHSLKPRLLTVAPTVAEAVRSAGGWLFDQALAGWDVTVMTAEQSDERALRILGVRECSLEKALSYHADGSCLSAIALPASMLADDRVRELVHAAVESGLPELRLWGAAEADTATAGLASHALPVSHRLSAAARAFKAQALVAAAICGEGPDTTEVFRRSEFRRLSMAAAR